MSISMAQDVMMIVPGGGIEEGLSVSASRNNWPILEGLSVSQTLREVVIHNPRVVVVQLGRMLEQAMALIGSLRQLRPGTKIVAAAVVHHELLEQAARIAGVTCYLPAADDGATLEETVASVAQSAARVEAEQERRVAHRRSRPTRTGTLGAMMIALVLLFLGAASAKASGPIVLTDKKSSVYFNIDGTGVPAGTPRGIYDSLRPQYVLGETPSNPSNPLHDFTQQWFWFAVGSTGHAAPLNTLTLASAPRVTNKNPSVDSDPDRLTLTYNWNGGSGKKFQITVIYDVMGSATYGHTLGLTRTVAITNTGTKSLNLHLWDYSDLTLTHAEDNAPGVGGGLGGVERWIYPDLGEILTSDRRTIRQWDYDGGYDPVTHTYLYDHRLNSDSQVVSLQTPLHAGFGMDGSIKTLLNGGATTSAFSNGAILATQGPGDLEYFFEYGINLAPGQGWIGGANLLITPEPGSLLLLAIPVVVLMFGRPMRRASSKSGLSG